MPYASDRAASRYGRDRDVFPAGPRVGPYELRYDVRRGYDQPLRERPADDASTAGVLLFRARDPDQAVHDDPAG